MMVPVETFLQDAATATGLAPDVVLARVLHIDDGAFEEVIAGMDDATKTLAQRLDREMRVRNPGLHYVMRKMFVGYRREGVMPSPLGERSQIFASMVRNNSRLDVVLPVDAACVARVANARDLRGRGHHGVGDVRVSLRDDAAIDQFLCDFDEWLRPLPKV